MIIWLITIGEPLPIDGSNERLLRTGIVAQMLSERGHDVIWWTSTFDHTRKRHRFKEDISLSLSDNYQLRLLHAVGYNKNISIWRLVNHYSIANTFTKYIHKEARPDIILCSFPAIELSLAATRYANEHNIPIVLDVRDLWPDIFIELVPVWGKKIARYMLQYLFQATKEACTRADAIIGITPRIVDWALAYAGRNRTEWDVDFPHGYHEKTPERNDILKAELLWKQRGIEKSGNNFIACYFGSMGRQFELETVISAAINLGMSSRSYRFVLCGDGENLPLYKKIAQKTDSVIFPGWVGKAEIWTLMRMSTVGLAPYKSTFDFTASLPNKSIEYLSAGLPIISSLQGELKHLLSSKYCGITYANGNSDELASILIDLLDNPQRIMTMSRNALMLYKERFIAENVYDNLIRYLQNMVAQYHT